MKAKILVIDDDPFIIQYYKCHFGQLEKAEVKYCESGAQAIEISKDFTPDIIIMDYSLPDITGLELTSIFVMQYPAVIVIAISGADRKDLESSMLELGAISFLKKPVNSRVLFLTVQNFIEIVLSRKSMESGFCDIKNKPSCIKTEKVGQEYIVPDKKIQENTDFLGNKAVPKSTEEFFDDMQDDVEYVDDFLEKADNLFDFSDQLYARPSTAAMLKAADMFDQFSKKLNFIQEFPSIAYASSMAASNLKDIDYKTIGAVPLKKLSVFTYDYIELLHRWAKAVFYEKTADDVHFMDFEILGYIMQIDSVFGEEKLLSETDEKASDEGGSIEFF